MVNIGIIGAGYWGPNLVRNFNLQKDCQVRMVADAKEDRRAFINAQYPGVVTVATGEELIADARIDAVVIATPVDMHFELAQKALSSGRHVLLEKPMTASAAEAEELINLAERKNLRLMVDHTFIYTGAIRKVKELADAGTVGDILYFDSVRVNLGLFQHDVNVIWDLAPHDVSIMDHLMSDRAAGVSAIGRRHFGSAVEDIAYLTVVFNSNAIAHFHVNWIAPVKVRTTLIGGTKRMVVYDDMEPSEKIKVYDKGVELVTDEETVRKILVEYRVGDMTAPKIDGTEALRLMSREFLDSIHENRAPLTDGGAGYRIVRVLEAANESLENNGRIIPLD
jgi:predicted dehydrogenase